MKKGRISKTKIVQISTKQSLCATAVHRKLNLPLFQYVFSCQYKFQWINLCEPISLNSALPAPHLCRTFSYAEVSYTDGLQRYATRNIPDFLSNSVFFMGGSMGFFTIRRSMHLRQNCKIWFFFGHWEIVNRKMWVFFVIIICRVHKHMYALIPKTFFLKY